MTASQIGGAPSTLDVAIRGMSCAACVRRIETAIRAVPGVLSGSVNLISERATVILDGTPGAASNISAAIRDAGFEPVETRLEFRVDGMSCASCIGRVEHALARVPGVIAASANLVTGRVTILALDTAHLARRAAAALDDAGYKAVIIDDRPGSADHDQARRTDEMAALKQRVVVAAIGTVPLLVLEMGAHMSAPLHRSLDGAFGQDGIRYMSFVFATLVLFGPGLSFYRRGLPLLWRGVPDMNSLVAIGTAAAYAYSVCATFMPQILPAGSAHTYFESAAVVITLILLGRWLEARAKGRTGDAIRKLLTLEAKSAHVVRDGAVVEVAIDTVLPGDLVVVRPGERIPVDGQVTEGSSYVDVSMITGEPMPVQTSIGATVVGGSINTSGSLTFRATKVGADTLLSQIVRTVEAAQGAKLPMQAMVDRVTNWFVPAVIGLSCLTFLAWLVFGPSPALSHALIHAVTVLIVACPCAMGLATPTSIMVSTGKAAEMGVLFRRGDALEKLRAVTVVAVDKTGTLTAGKPAMTDITVAAGFNEAHVLGCIAAVERKSEHPVATAIVGAARARGLKIGDATEFVAEPGLGVRARVGTQVVVVGSGRMMQSLGLDVQAFSTAVEQFADSGKTPFYAAIDNRLAAVIAVADPIKDTTPAAIADLRRLGKRVVMITGDNRRTAEAIARRLGIDEVIAEVLPTDKADRVKQLQQLSGTQTVAPVVAFIGDGINDAPALAQADVSLAIGNGTDIAIESADAVLMTGNLRQVANAMALSEATVENIRQNLWWAFGYNVVLIPVAAGVLHAPFGIVMSPMLAGLAMALSSVCVITNALRLRRFRPPFGGRPATATRKTLHLAASGTTTNPL